MLILIKLFSLNLLSRTSAEKKKEHFKKHFSAAIIDDDFASKQENKQGKGNPKISRNGSVWRKESQITRFS